MQAIKLGKKYPDVDVFDLINKFKCVSLAEFRSGRSSCTHGTRLMVPRQIDVDDRGSLDKATVIQALQSSGDADYDSVSRP